jgi:dihydrofolate synthase/folylpolyglutamate synthase
MGSKPGLERITRLLELMKNPQNDYKCIHIAGTNGKGSTSVIIANVLAAAGYRVGRFTSPHLHFYRERIIINNETIDAEHIRQGLDQIEEHVAVMLAEGYDHPTEFEILTALAFWYFSLHKVNVAVIEVGMGGLYDSTNVIIPLVSVITSVDIDHTRFLGSTLADIAFNKAGIIKRNVPVVVGPMPESGLNIIERQAAKLNAEIYPASLTQITRLSAPLISGQKISLECSWAHVEKCSYSLLGDYQLTNLATAVTALGLVRQNGFKVEAKHLPNVLAELKMPGRLEIVQKDPLIIIDVAHNAQGARALHNSLKTLLPGRSKVLVCGVLDDKDAYGILQNMGEDTRAIVITRPEGIRGDNWRRLNNIWHTIFPDVPCYCEEDIMKAVELGCKQLTGNEYLLVAGSFYVVGRARRELINT